MRRAVIGQRSDERVTDVTTEPAQRRGWPAAAAIAIAALCTLGVFWLPWHLPVVLRPIVSDSQAAGFVNRGALLSLGFAVVALFMVAWLGKARGQGFVSLEPQGAHVSRWLVAGAMVAGVAITVLLALVFRDHPYGEASYFLDRTLYLVNGSRPYIDFEFSYGPLLIYPQYVVWLVLRPLGVSIFWVYYLCYAAETLLGLWLLVFVVDRLKMSRGLKNVVFATLAVIAVTQIAMGLQYTLIRYAAPLALLVFVLQRSSRISNRFGVAVMAVGAVAVAAAVSPEVGIALLIGLLAAFGLTGLRGDRASWVPVTGLCAVALMLALLVASHSTFTDVVGGAAALPVSPGLPAVLYLGSMLLLAWAAGASVRGDDPRIASLQVGWLVVTLVLGAAALGRADWGHVLLNGLGAFLAAPAILLTRRRWLAQAFTTLFAASFCVQLVVFQLIAVAPGALVTAVQAGAIPPAAAPQIASITPYWSPVAAAAPQARETPGQLATLLNLRSVATPWRIASSLGLALAERHALAPSYAPGGYSYSDAQRIQAEVSKASYVLLRTADYNAYVDRVRSETATVDPPMITVLPYASRAVWFSLSGWPFALPVRNPTLDTDLFFARYLAREWTPDRVVGGYTILRRAAAR